MSNFKHVINATSKKDILESDIEYPCVVLVAKDTREARNEAIDICFEEARMFWTSYLPSIILMAVGVIILVYEYFDSP